jgi:hypothetical protein
MPGSLATELGMKASLGHSLKFRFQIAIDDQIASQSRSDVKSKVKMCPVLVASDALTARLDGGVFSAPLYPYYSPPIPFPSRP